MIPSGVVATPRWDADFAGLPLTLTRMSGSHNRR